MDAAGVTRPILFGSNSAAQLACLYAASHPDRVRGLATYAMWSHLAGRHLQEWQTYLEWTASHFGSLEAALNEVRDVQPSRAGDPGHLAWMVRLQRSAWSPGSFRPMVEVQMALDIRDVLPAISVPTLAMYRPGDSSVPVDDMRSSAALIHGATVVELPGMDHECSAGPMAPMIDALEGFIASLDGTKVSEFATPARPSCSPTSSEPPRAPLRSATRPGRDLIAAHHGIVRRELERFSGTEVDTRRRRILRDLRWAGPGRPLRPGDRLPRRGPRARDPGRRPHG